MIPAGFRKLRLPVFGIRAVLIFLLLPGVVVLLVIDSWNDYRSLTKITNAAYDSALLESARVLESSAEFADDGTLRLVTPLYAQVMLESKAGLRKYFRIEEIGTSEPADRTARDRTRTLAGMPELPAPPKWPASNGDPVFFDSVYRNDPVRAVAVLRDLHYRGLQRRMMVVVAESVARRQAAEHEAQRQEILRDIRMLLLVAVLVWLGVAWALRPLVRLRNDIRTRRPDDLTPLDASHVPAEVTPLVEAVNHHIARHRRVLDEQTQFLADASHQLRTPLAIMLTQAQYALREPDPVRAREGLRAVLDQLARTRRLTEQLLSLAHASQGMGTPQQLLDLNTVARDVVLQYLPLAHEKHQDLGWVGAPPDPASPHGLAVPVWGSEAELHEALANLVHNAIHYAPEGARVTVSAARVKNLAEVCVSDNGPGIPSGMRQRVFARFDRAGAERGLSASGSGLGLSIARTYARHNRGDIALRDGDPNVSGGHGLAAVLWMPLADAALAPCSVKTP